MQHPYFLTDEEISQICYPLTQPKARREWLKKSGIAFTYRPDGHPIVIRDHVYTANSMPVPMSMRSTEPDRNALMQKIQKKT
jgi:hypothetical protein